VRQLARMRRGCSAEPDLSKMFAIAGFEYG